MPIRFHVPRNIHFLAIILITESVDYCSYMKFNEITINISVIYEASNASDTVLIHL